MYTASTALEEPAFASPMGVAQAWTVGTAIAPITVPAATGSPAYAVQDLPAGLAFDAATREITGTPTTEQDITVWYDVEDVDGDTDAGVFEFSIAAAGAPPSGNRVEITLPVHNEFQTDRIRWQNFTDGLGDVSALLAVAGTEALSRFQLNGNGADASNNCQLRTLGGAELNADFEGYASAITVEVTGLDDLVMAGPASALHTTDDSSEPYQFVPGDDYDTGAISYLYSGNDQPAGLAAWVEDFKAAYAADNSIRATLILDDGS